MIIVYIMVQPVLIESSQAQIFFIMKISVAVVGLGFRMIECGWFCNSGFKNLDVEMMLLATCFCIHRFMKSDQSKSTAALGLLLTCMYTGGHCGVVCVY